LGDCYAARANKQPCQNPDSINLLCAANTGARVTSLLESVGQSISDEMNTGRMPVPRTLED